MICCLNHYLCVMLKDFKPVLWILSRFMLIYFILFLGYQAYLQYVEPLGLDPYSRWIAGQVSQLQNALGYSSHTIHYPAELTEVFFIDELPVSRMVEGCNAVSVMILCVAFIFAFYQGRKTFAYALVGLVFLYVTNVFRIVGINILCIEKPEWGDAAHDYLFPSVIYGSVVVLWLIWMRIVVRNTSK